MLKNNIGNSYLREDEDDEYIYLLDVTEKAREIFGDIVVKAEVVLERVFFVDNFDEKSESDIRKSIEKHEKPNGVLNFDGTEIFIEFTSGNKVRFHSSEWGNMSKLQ